MLKKEGEVRIQSGCAIAAIIDRTGERFDGTDTVSYTHLCQVCGYDGELQIVEEDGKLVWR